MAHYLIGYDLHRPGQNYDALYDAIKSYGTYAHILDSTWIIRTSTPVASVRDRLMAHIDTNDTLFVIEVTSNWGAANLAPNFVNWLNSEPW